MAPPRKALSSAAVDADAADRSNAVASPPPPLPSRSAAPRSAAVDAEDGDLRNAAACDAINAEADRRNAAASPPPPLPRRSTARMDPMKAPSSAKRPRLPDSRRRACANDLLDDAVDSDVASGSMGEGENNLLGYDVCPPDNSKIWRDLAKNLLLRIDSSAPKRPCPPDNNSNNWRDWANLADGPAGLIAERILAYDVADYVRYRAVCRPWRQSSTEPRTHSGLDRRFHPWRWTMLREDLAAPDRRCFLNTSTGECVKVDIPELNDHELLAITPEGLLVLAHKPPCTTTICLLNPLTRNLMQLPPLSTLVPSEYHDDMLPERDALCLKSDFKAWGSGIANDDSTVVLFFNQLSLLGMAKPGDDHWTLLEYNGGVMTAAPIMFEGRFYCVTHSGLMGLAIGPPRFEVAAKLNMRTRLMADSFHLVNNCGELMLVHSRLRDENMSRRFYDTYRVDLDTGTVIPVKSLGSAGRALFLGQLCSLSVSLEVFPSGSISADTIYLSFDMYERVLLKVEAYHLADGSVEPPNSVVPRPHTLADCLSLANTI